MANKLFSQNGLIQRENWLRGEEYTRPKLFYLKLTYLLSIASLFGNVFQDKFFLKAEGLFGGAVI